MPNDREESTSAEPGGRFHTVQPLRDPESNWAVDLAKNLEDYLLKICSGEITGDDDAHLSVNFAEAALLLQGSIQVYSRKVEYLYSLVLHALEFISQKKQQDQPENTSVEQEEHGSNPVPDEENDLFSSFDEIPVEAKNSLDRGSSKDAPLNQFVKPPANLVVLEGDCLDATGDGELESYLLATSDLYNDFILLDPCDVVAVNEFVKCDKAGKGHNAACRGSSLASKSRKSFLSPTRASGYKPSVGKRQDSNVNQSPRVDCGFEFNDCDVRPDTSACNVSGKNNFEFEMDDGYSAPQEDDSDDDDGDDPWKPLNPHEPGNLKVKPFKKAVKVSKRQGTSSVIRMPVTAQFPLAKLHGTISSELTQIWEVKRSALEKERESQSPSLYEKMRQSLVNGGSGDASFSHKDFNADSGYDSEDPGYGNPEFDMPESREMYEDIPSPPEKDNGCMNFDNAEAHAQEDPNLQESLEDLCQSHLDSLLASIAENEKQTELAARVSTWKQRIEFNLEEQDARSPFDIHEYGRRVLEKLSLDAGSKNIMSFTDVVRGQEKHDIARTFSAMLQLVNNGNIDLEKGGADGESKCYTAVNPFHIRLLHDKNGEEVRLRSSKKRVKSPIKKGGGGTKGDRDKMGREKHLAVSSPPSGPSSSSMAMSKQLNCNFSMKMGKVVGVALCSPERKRRRRSQLVEPVDLHSSAG